MQVRTGSGAMQAVQRVVERGRGAVVQELSDVLTWTRSGVGEAEAFRRAAELTPEPSARGRTNCSPPASSEVSISAVVYSR